LLDEGIYLQVYIQVRVIRGEVELSPGLSCRYC